MNRESGILILGVLMVVQLASSPALATGVGPPDGVQDAPPTEDWLVNHPAALDSAAPASQAAGSPPVLTRVLTPVIDRPVLLLPPAGYSRYDDSDPLENDNRREVYEHVRRVPGTTLSDVVSETGIPRSTARYHVRILVHERLVRSERILGKHRLFEQSLDDAGLRAILNEAPTATIVRAVDRHEPVQVTDVASSVGRSPSTISYHLTRLEAEGLIDKERDGPRVVVRLTSAARLGLIQARSPE